jgi:hypothetical protein
MRDCPSDDLKLCWGTLSLFIAQDGPSTRLHVRHVTNRPLRNGSDGGDRAYSGDRD